MKYACWISPDTFVEALGRLTPNTRSICARVALKTLNENYVHLMSLVSALWVLFLLVSNPFSDLSAVRLFIFFVWRALKLLPKP